MKKVEEILESKFLQIGKTGLDGFSGIFVDPVERKNYFFVFSWGGGWEHLSVSQKNKTPSWDVMCRIKDIFWTEDECCVEYHPKKGRLCQFSSTLSPYLERSRKGIPYTSINLCRG